MLSLEQIWKFRGLRPSRLSFSRGEIRPESVRSADGPRLQDGLGLATDIGRVVAGPRQSAKY